MKSIRIHSITMSNCSLYQPVSVSVLLLTQHSTDGTDSQIASHNVLNPSKGALDGVTHELSSNHFPATTFKQPLSTRNVRSLLLATVSHSSSLDFPLESLRIVPSDCLQEDSGRREIIESVV